MTGNDYLKNKKNFVRNLKTARKISEIANITSVSLTGKGEPMLSIKGYDWGESKYPWQ
jgi:wyosine [tRNA(Phe)-imidazoG37] synthetase (radical SAM superfamily)